MAAVILIFVLHCTLSQSSELPVDEPAKHKKDKHKHKKDKHKHKEKDKEKKKKKDKSKKHKVRDINE